MDVISLTKMQVRNFILTKQGLIGPKRFLGKTGIMEFVRQAGCIQFDPIDICGRNADLTLQSRIDHYSKTMLSELLYQDRQLIDYFDKNLSIILTDEWPYFANIRDYFQKNARSIETVNALRDEIKARIKEKGFVCSKDFVSDEKVHWYWGKTGVARVALEALYFFGELVIHHKVRTIKYYALAEDYLPITSGDSNLTPLESIDLLEWKVLRRIGSVGMLWNKHSDAFLFVDDLKTPNRNKVFSSLLAKELIIEIQVEGIKEPLYCLSSDRELLNSVLYDTSIPDRVEFLAPLDNMLWDRKLIKALFDFEYSWEIYTPEQKRRYGYYVLPVLFRNDLVGRIELIREKKANRLFVKQLWLEDSFSVTQPFIAELDLALLRFKNFSEVGDLVMSPQVAKQLIVKI